MENFACIIYGWRLKSRVCIVVGFFCAIQNLSCTYSIREIWCCASKSIMQGYLSRGDYFKLLFNTYFTTSASVALCLWMLLSLLLIWKSIVDDDGWKLLMPSFLFDVGSTASASVVLTSFGSLMGVNDSSPLESFNISAPNWWRAVIVDGVGSGMLSS